MPPKKRTSSKKKAKGRSRDPGNLSSGTHTLTVDSSRGTTSPPTAATPATATTLIHKDDDIEQVFHWIERDGRITAARLAKRLPHTAQLLRDGEISHDAVTEELFERVIARRKAAGAKRGARQLWSSSIDDNEGILGRLTCGLVSRIMVLDEQALRADIVDDLFLKLRRAVTQGAETDAWKASERIALTRAVKQAVDETFASWEEKVDAKVYFGHLGGTFRQECSFSDAPLEAFDTLLVDDFYRMLVGDATQKDIYERLVWDATSMDHHVVHTRLSLDLRLATLTISQGVDEGSKVCWECGAALATANECTGCTTALYCGSKCQLKAWKGGHNGACSNLKVKHDNFVESLQAVDDAHRSGVLEGMQLCRSFEYDELVHVHTLAFDDYLGDPSMKFYYENLARMIRGE